jgi:hypothetical protein
MKLPWLSCLLLVALLAVGASVIAWREYRELLPLRSASAVNTAERAALQKTAWDAQRRAKQLADQLAALRAQIAAGGFVATAPADGAAADTAQNRVIGNVVNTWLDMMNDPEAQQLMALQQKAQISSRYAPVLRALKLTPDQIAQFKALLLEKQTVRNDVLLSATQQGINPLQNPQELRDLEASAQAEIDAKIKTVLGDDAYAQFQNFQQTQGQRGIVNQLRDSLSYTATPLTKEQSDELVPILARTGPPRDANPARVATNATVTDATVSQAQQILSPPQLDALKEIQQQQQAGAKLQQYMQPARGLPGAGLGRLPGGG